jgi:hypothetical protein
VEAERGLTGGEFGEGRIAAVDRSASGWPAENVAVPAAHARAAAFALVGMIAVAVAVRIVLSWQVATPWILVDEFLYSELAKSFAERGELLVRELPFGRLGVLYPVLISPAWLFDSMATTYGLAKSINAVLMCLAAMPVYLWARRLVSPTLSLVAAALVLLLPAYVYTGNIMTENAFFPAFVLALYAAALVLERPTLPTQGLALAAVAAATAVRVQGVILVAIFVVAVGVKVLLDLRAQTGPFRALVRPYVPSLAALAALALGYVAWKLAQGADLASGLGAYAGVSGAGYSEREAVRWVFDHAAELALAVGVAPLAALLVLTGLAAVRGLPSAAERAFVAIAVSAVTLLVVQVGIYASRFALRIEERNMIHVAPVLLLALVVWIGRGLPRPPLLASVAALASAALLLTIPLATLLNISILSDTFALIPLLRLDASLSGGVPEVRALMVAGGFAAALAFLLAPRRLATVGLPLALGLYFVIVTNSVLGAVGEYSRNIRSLAPADASWLDDRVGPDAEVPFLVGSATDLTNEGVGQWQFEFWNRSLAGVYNLGVPALGYLPQLGAQFDRASGRIVADDPGLAEARYVMAARGLDLAERRIEGDGQRVVYRAEPPLLVESVSGGVFSDGWMGPAASYDRYTGPAGELTVALSREAWGGPDKPGGVRIDVGALELGPDGAPTIVRPTASRTWTIHSRARRSFQLPTPKPPFRAFVHIEPTFSPAEYGKPDTRQLGAQVTFAFKPAR